MAAESSDICKTSAEVYEFACSPCCDDGKHTEGLFECVDCEMLYCHVCKDIHNKFTKNHTVHAKTSAQFGRASIQATARASELPTDICEEHQREVIKMFCGQHNIVCCAICIALKHRACEGVEYIPNISKGLTQTHHKEQIETLWKEMRIESQNMKSKMQNALLSLDKRHDCIKEFKENIIACVITLEETSLSELRTKRQEVSDVIEASSRKIDGLLEDVELKLNKLKTDGASNEAQNFVDIKYAEKLLLKAPYCTEKAKQNVIRTMEFEENSTVTNCLLHVASKSLGILTVLEQPQSGTTAKLKPPKGWDSKNYFGTIQDVETRHQCITAMEIYRDKSLEELRIEDYAAGRRGNPARKAQSVTPSGSCDFQQNKQSGLRTTRQEGKHFTSLREELERKLQELCTDNKNDDEISSDTTQRHRTIDSDSDSL